MCPTLKHILHGKIEIENTSQKQKTVAAYLCKSGYMLSGSKYRTCQVDGTWSGSEPQCVSKLTIL